MIDIIAIIFSGIIVFIAGYPIYEWIEKTKEEMEEKQNDQNE